MAGTGFLPMMCGLRMVMEITSGHFLRAMDAVPLLTPPGEDHIISSNSIIQEADYAGHLAKPTYLRFDNTDSNTVTLFYRCFDTAGIEKNKIKRSHLLYRLIINP